MSQTKAQLIDPVDGSLVNADINASAAIAGTKISPDFGSQNIVTTGETTTSDVFLGDSILHTGDTNTKIRFPAADTVSIETGGSERLRIDSSGRLQQGSDTSNLGSAKLNIVTGGEDGISIGKNATGNVSSGDVLGTYAFQSSVGAQTTNSAEASIKGIAAQDSSGSTAATDLAFFTKPSGTGPGSSPSERLRISSSGKVGIGLNSPSRMLQVKSSANNSTHISLVDADSTNEVFRVGQQSDGDGFVQLLDDSGAVQIGLEATGDSFFVGGDVGVGTSTPDTLLHLSGADTAILRLENTDTSLTTNQIIGGVEFEKQDASGAGVGVVGGLRMYSGVDGITTYLSLATANSSANNVEHMRLEHDGDLRLSSDNSATNYGFFDGWSDSSGQMQIGSDHGTTGTGTNVADIIFKTRGGEKVRVQHAGGISFNGDTAAANALDDYEEGSWTPTFGNLETAPTYSTQYGRYCKNGSLVTVVGQISANGGGLGSDGSAVNIAGLPFVGNSAAEVCLFTLGRYTDLLPQGELDSFKNVRFGGNFVMLHEGSNSDISYAECNTSGNLQFAISYITNT